MGDSIEGWVVARIAEIREVDTAELDPTPRLDSLEWLALSVDIELTFGVSLLEATTDDLVSVEALAGYIARTM